MNGEALAKAVHAPGYESLARVLLDALEQAAHGKGRDRHAGPGEPFDEQPMQVIVGMFGPGFALGQAVKKLHESQRLGPTAGRAELLGAIVYIAGAVMHIDRQGAARDGS